MNILLIGNGFDLAHGLPTKYTDFLEFVNVIKQALDKGRLSGIDWGNTDTEVKNLLIHDKGRIQKNLFSNKKNWEDLINNNIWIDYFLNNPMYQKEKWIDFESEMSNVIKSLDDGMISESASLEDSLVKCSNWFLYNKFCDDIDYSKPQFSTYRELPV